MKNRIKNLKQKFNIETIKQAFLYVMFAAMFVMNVSPAFCDINGNTTMQKFLKMLFAVLVFVGIIMFAVGLAMIIKTVVAITSGEQAQPGALGRGIGFVIGGIVLMAIIPILTAIIGVNPTTLTFY